MVTVQNAKEHASALKNDEIEITVEGEIEKPTITIMATGKVAWAIAVAAIAIAATAVIASLGTGGAATPAAAGAAAIAAPTAVATLGVGTTTSAIAVAVAAGGIGALNKLRSYELVKESGKTFLKKS